MHEKPKESFATRVTVGEQLNEENFVYVFGSVGAEWKPYDSFVGDLVFASEVPLNALVAEFVVADVEFVEEEQQMLVNASVGQGQENENVKVWKESVVEVVIA